MSQLAPAAVSVSRLPLRIMILDDEPATVGTLTHFLSTKEWEVIGAQSIREAAASMDSFVPDVMVVDVYLGEEDGLEYVKVLRQRHPDLGIVVISAEDTQTLARKAIECGADYFLSKPIAPAALTLTVGKLSELRAQRIRNLELERELKREHAEGLFPQILTHSDSMKAVLRLIEKVASRDLSVLICGESGTGKELVARAVHQRSNRNKGAFVELNCAALPPNLVESELFGHEKGAFTGAVASRPGKVELASGGTLFLDEIGELPLEVQPKFLRALQERRITRVGGKRDIECDFRLVTATHRDLLNEVRKGGFREDLFYRVAVFPIKLPPLRERMEDLDLLLTSFLRHEGIKHPAIDPEVTRLLHSYHWPGNIRELKNFAQAVTLLTDNGEIDEAAVRTYFGTRLGENFRPGQRNAGAPPPVSAVPAGQRPIRKLEDIEREEILYALQVYKGNVPEAAMALGMGRATLYKYIKRHEYELGDFS